MAKPQNTANPLLCSLLLPTLRFSLLLPVLPAMREGEALQSKVGLIYCSLARCWILKQHVCS